MWRAILLIDILTSYLREIICFRPLTVIRSFVLKKALIIRLHDSSFDIDFDMRSKRFVCTFTVNVDGCIKNLYLCLLCSFLFISSFPYFHPDTEHEKSKDCMNVTSQTGRSIVARMMFLVVLIPIQAITSLEDNSFCNTFTCRCPMWALACTLATISPHSLQVTSVSWVQSLHVKYRLRRYRYLRQVIVIPSLFERYGMQDPLSNPCNALRIAE